MTENFDPRAALDAADDARRHLADRVVTPWWYHPAYGVFIALVCLGLGLPEGVISHQSRMSLFLAVIFGNVAITAAYRRTTGVWIATAAGPRTGRLMVGFAAGLAACFGASAANGLLGGPWWVPVALGALAIAAATVFGRHYDDALRGDLRAGVPR